jgi:MFS family permease
MATLANQIQSVAVAWQIYAIARSPLALGYVGLAQFLPVAALFFVAGDVADRYNRRRILAISYAVQAVAAAVLLVLTLLAAKSQWPFYAALVLLGSARAFGQPRWPIFPAATRDRGAVPAGSRVDFLGMTDGGHLRARAWGRNLYLGTGDSLRGLPILFCRHQHCDRRAADRQPSAAA